MTVERLFVGVIGSAAMVAVIVLSVMLSRPHVHPTLRLRNDHALAPKIGALPTLPPR